MRDDGRAEGTETVIEALDRAFRASYSSAPRLEWVAEKIGEEIIGYAADVLPHRPYPDGPALSAYQEAEIGLAVGPSEIRFVGADVDSLAERAVEVLTAFLAGGARVVVERRGRGTRTTLEIPASGARIATSSWGMEFPGYPVGVHELASPGSP